MAENKTLDFLKKKGNLIKEGAEFDIKDGTKIIGVYFSAHWCPPCRGFTPVLAEFYKKFPGESFEIVFVSSDRDQASFDDYFKDMPWAALKFDKRSEKEELSNMNGVRGIPTFVVFDSDGNVIHENGRGKVMESQAAEFTKFPF